MRNIDFIRKMKAKDLTKFMAYQICDGCNCCVYHAEKPCPDTTLAKDCHKGTKKWLKSEYNQNDKVWSELDNEVC